MQDIKDITNKIICGDSLKILKQIPDKSIDLILTDPPYGIGYQYESYDDTKENLVKLIGDFMPEFFRIANNIVLTCGVTNIGKYPEPYWIMAWYNSAGANRGKWGFSCWQPILCYGKDPYLTNGLGARADIIKDNTSSEKWINHSCSKPKTFWEKLLLRSSVKETDLILDPFAGSFTTAVVCQKNHRNWICIEKEPKYCEI